jgi:ubiquinone/menaquinone biosynthesis C-methylase UbiE
VNNNNHRTKFIIDTKYEESVKKSFYDDFYTEITDNQIEWRRLASIEKCESILELSKGLKLHTVVDIGAGLCSVIMRLDQLGLAHEFYALEVSPSLVRFIKEKISIPRLKAVYLLDTSKTGFDRFSFDLGILSHVLEHVSNPIELLSEALRICKYVVVEVPLEDCLFANIYSKYTEKITGHKRSDNPIGHIIFFNKPRIRNLVAKSGGVVLRERTYRSWKIYPKESKITTIFRLFKSVTLYSIFRITNSRLVGANHTLLVKAHRG